MYLCKFAVLLVVLVLETQAVSPTDLIGDDISDICWNFTVGISLTLSTPYYPLNYPTKFDCRKVIKAGSHFQVSLTFSEFHLEASESCRYDYLEIRDGPYGFSPLLFKGCGDDLESGAVFVSTRQYMWVRIYSDTYITRKGFLASITAKPQTDALNIADHSVSDFDDADCFTLLQDPIRFELTEDSVPHNVQNFYRAYPERPIDCVWDIRHTEVSRVLVRVLNYSDYRLVEGVCHGNFLEFYDQSTADFDRKLRMCHGKPESRWISASTRTIIRLHAQSLHHLPKFHLFGNTYVKESSGNCSNEGMFPCFDSFCIPESLTCNGEANCGEEYDEDNCNEGMNYRGFSPKYVIMFVVFALLSVTLVSVMTLIDALHKRKKEQKKLLANEERKTGSSSSRSGSMHYTRNSMSTNPGSRTGTFRNSRLNENVSFRKATPSTSSAFLVERIYHTPNQTPISQKVPHLPPPPRLPTPPPPPAPIPEAKGFRLLHDLTQPIDNDNLLNFEYPAPPPLASDEDYTSSSSSSSSDRRLSESSDGTRPGYAATWTSRKYPHSPRPWNTSNSVTTQGENYNRLKFARMNEGATTSAVTKEELSYVSSL